MKGQSNEQLMAEIDECRAEIKLLETRELVPDEAPTTARRSLKEILNSDVVQPSKEPTHTQTNQKGKETR